MLGSIGRFRSSIAEVRVGSRLCKNAEVEVCRRSRLAHEGEGLCSDRLHQTTNVQNADYPFHVVGQDVQPFSETWKATSKPVPEKYQHLRKFAFGDGPELADELFELVIKGIKTATCSTEDELNTSTPVPVVN